MQKSFQILLFISLFYTYIPQNIMADEIEKYDTPINKNDREEKISFSIGGSIFYAWWSPVWLKENWKYYSLLVPGASPVHEYRMEGAQFLYGPVLSINFGNRVSISGSFMYGEYRAKGKYFSPDILHLPNILPMFQFKHSKKYDADMLMNIEITKWIKLYIGPKYQGYQESKKETLYGYATRSIKDSTHTGGLGFGINFLMPLFKNLYLIHSINGIYLFGAEIQKNLGTTRVDYISACGFSFEDSFAYYIPFLRSSISFGFRYQQIEYLMLENNKYMNNRDSFYGFRLALWATF